MVTFNQIKKYLNPLKYKNSKYVQFKDVRVGFNDKNLTFFVARSSSPYIWDSRLKRKVTNPTRNNTYTTTIEVLNKKGNVKLSCSCPDFLFRHEVALFTKDAAEIEYSNGDYPEMTNPLLQPSCCKHCLALYEALHKKGILK